MISNKFHLFLICITAFVMSACQKDIDAIIPNAGQLNGPDTTWYNNITAAMPVTSLKNELLYNLNLDSFQLNGGAINTFTTSSGLSLKINGGALETYNGQPYFGMINAESMLLNKKGDFIRMGISTISNNSQLVSGGAFYLGLRSSTNEELFVSQNNNIVVGFYPEDHSIQSLGMYLGVQNNTSPFNWLPSNDITNNYVSLINDDYISVTNNLHWINCANLYNNPGVSQTKIALQIPANYTNANTVAFISFDDMQSVIEMTGNVMAEKFQSINLPVNEHVSVIVISKQGNDYFLGHTNIITANPSTQGAFQNIQVSPVITSFANMKNYISTL